MKKKRWTGMLFVLPHLCGTMLFLLLPFCDVVRRSFLRAAGGFAGLANYREVLNNEAFRLAAGNTFRFAAVCLPLLLSVSLMLALAARGLGKRAARLKQLSLIPMAIPAACVALLWRLLFDTHGMLNGLLAACGLDAVDWMNTGASFFVLVGSYLWKNLGYVMTLWIAALGGISPSLYEAARMDGAGRLAMFRFITLPLLRGATFSIGVLCFLNLFQVFREAYLVAGSYPQEQIYLISHLFHNWFLSLSVDKMAAGAVLLAAVTGAAVGVLQIEKQS